MNNLIQIYNDGKELFLDNFYDFKYGMKSGIYFLNDYNSRKLGFNNENIYTFGILFIYQNQYGFFMEYHPDFHNHVFQIVNKIAYCGSFNFYQIHNDEELKTMKMNEIKWFYSDLHN